MPVISFSTLYSNDSEYMYKRNSPSFDLEMVICNLGGDAKALLYGLMGCTTLPYRCHVSSYSLNDILFQVLPKRHVLILRPDSAESVPKTHIRAIQAPFRLQKLRRSISNSNVCRKETKAAGVETNHSRQYYRVPHMLL